jgi:hypothetical protein
MHEDAASTDFRRPSPSYRPTRLKWGSADEWKSYNRFRAFLSEPLLSHLLNDDMELKPWVDRLADRAAA